MCIQKTRLRQTILLTLMTVSLTTARAQTLAAKTNLLNDVLLIPTLGAEYAVGSHSTLQLTGTYTPFAIDEHKWKNWSIQPEYRYWTQATFTGLFIGINAVVGGYNINKVRVGNLYDRQRQGTMIGGGISMGYHHILSTRLSLEFVAAADYLHCTYDRYDGLTKEGRFRSDLILPLGTGINLIYILK